MPQSAPVADVWFDATRDCVAFTMKRYGDSVVCYVSREALKAHYGTQDESACLVAAKANMAEIQNQILHKMSIGELESDGSVLLLSNDW